MTRGANCTRQVQGLPDECNSYVHNLGPIFKNKFKFKFTTWTLFENLFDRFSNFGCSDNSLAQSSGKLKNSYNRPFLVYRILIYMVFTNFLVLRILTKSFFQIEICIKAFNAVILTDGKYKCEIRCF